MPRGPALTSPFNLALGDSLEPRCPLPPPVSPPQEGPHHHSCGSSSDSSFLFPGVASEHLNSDFPPGSPPLPPTLGSPPVFQPRLPFSHSFLTPSSICTPALLSLTQHRQCCGHSVGSGNSLVLRKHEASILPGPLGPQLASQRLCSYSCQIPSAHHWPSLL